MRSSVASRSDQYAAQFEFAQVDMEQVCEKVPFLSPKVNESSGKVVVMIARPHFTLSEVLVFY